MSDRAEMEARHTALLDRLQQLSLSLAEDLHAAALAAEAPAEKAQLATAFQRMGRALRQTVALEAKLVRDAQCAPPEPAPDPDAIRQARRQRRAAELREAVERLIWTEYEANENLFDELDFIIEAVTHNPYDERPLEQLVDEVFRELGEDPPSARRRSRKAAGLELGADNPPDSVPPPEPGVGADSS